MLHKINFLTIYALAQIAIIKNSIFLAKRQAVRLILIPTGCHPYNLDDILIWYQYINPINDVESFV